MWIGGEFVGSHSEKTFRVVNPATEEILAEVPRGDRNDAADAVEAAAGAFEEWRFMPGVERADLLHHVAAACRHHRTELARLMTQEGGKPLIENLDEVEWVAACFDFYAQVGRDQKGRVIPPVQRDQFNFVVKEPYGVVACIVPWNYPLLLMAWKVAPALAAGNCVVIKPSEYTPLSTLRMAECAFSHLPSGVVNVVTGYGVEAGEPLTTHPKTDLIAFTGSLATGKKVAGLAALGMKKINLELGGNDPFIVCDDVDLDVAVRGAVWAAFLNMGQVCTSAERFYVFESVADTFIQKFVERTRALRIGDPLGPDVDLGPMIAEFQRKKVEDKIEEGRRAGAKVLCGGQRPPGFAKGFYYEPTVLTSVDHTMPLMKEETFGPVAPIMVVKGIEEACRLANDSIYGLGANLYTTSLEHVFYAMERVKAGTFWINDPLTDNDAGPFGGMRASGFGRELGSEGLEAFRDTKHVHLDYKLSSKPYWFPYDWSKARKTE
ncbi:MAG: aldehyde dehydrogenase [Candidatus Riflebacteria bacterium]|nr:aldehyde dehydrogenase [Candidatus Riflebacteria bacterium]